MEDDIRRPRPESTETPRPVEENKYQSEVSVVAAPEQPASLPAANGASRSEQEEGFSDTMASRKQKRKGLFRIAPASKKQKILGGLIIAVLIIGGGGGAFALNKSFKNKPQNVGTPVAAKVENKPTTPSTEQSRLTGVEITPEVNKRPITSIQIENSPDARPQSGLKDAGVIFEAIAEGGITRFNASFLEGQPDYIGPVRSVRPYYAALAAPFDPIFVHAGGSAEGLAKISALGLKDMDHGANGSAFRRVSDRYAPHNLYTSSADLDKAAASRGYTSSNVKSLARKKEQAGQAVTARGIDIAISSALYNVHYDYDQATNTYLRSMGGRPHTDQRSGAQLAPKTVVAMVVGFTQNGIYSVYQTTGVGKVYIFQDGVSQTGTWTKTGDKEQIVFADDTGKPIALNSGQTWISLVKAPNSVAYKP
jgi:hypothetical protein